MFPVALKVLSLLLLLLLLLLSVKFVPALSDIKL
jgi:hypothetical protein